MTVSAPRRAEHGSDALACSGLLVGAERLELILRHRHLRGSLDNADGDATGVFALADVRDGVARLGNAARVGYARRFYIAEHYVGVGAAVATHGARRDDEVRLITGFA